MTKKPIQSASGKFGGSKSDKSFEQFRPINKITHADIAQFKIQCIRLPTFNTVDFYQFVATKSAIYPGQGSPLGLIYCGLKLNGEAGKLAEHIGKAMRDDDLMGSTPLTPGQINDNFVSYELTPKRRALIIEEIGDNLWYLSAICKELGISLSEASLTNLEKLFDRGALQGSGDER
jgi:NTP pyrophosphatase (non-canonical NTP hydrolase)